MHVMLSPSPPPPAGPQVAPADAARFDAFIRAHQPLLVAWLRRRAQGDDAMDVAQDTWMRLLRYAAQPDRHLKLLMFRIAQNVILDRDRAARSRAQAMHMALDEAQSLLASDEPPHVERIDAEAQLAKVREAVGTLPQRCREVYLLNRLEGMSYQAIARDRAISVKTVEKHISTALRILRARLAAGDDR